MTTAPAMMNWMTALADVTRARVLRLLERHELTVAELCAVLQLPQSTVSRHLKVLADDRWVSRRREGTSSLYRMASDELEPTARRLWNLVREQSEFYASAEQDDQRLASVLAERQTRSQAFFSSAAGQWDKLRTDLFGERFDLVGLAGLLDAQWIVGDLGCGTGQIAAAVAPFVKEVIAVDSAPAMITAAKKRLAAFDNIELRRGDLASLPIDDGVLDAATIYLVLHHISDPAAAMVEVARVLKLGGRVLIVDMLKHDREEYRQQMGHVWLGFDAKKITGWLTDAGLTDARFIPLPIEPAAKGPALFAASAMKGAA
ncbi:MAG: metalloregulator ArsR/SmtB family transcription factor [Planctomycetes bacterium]|nr:metalloregulator ArsR/SmtB family transcription factor [Planctomycetota bacterium]